MSDAIKAMFERDRARRFAAAEFEVERHISTLHGREIAYVWVSLDGRATLIREMSDTHITYALIKFKFVNGARFKNAFIAAQPGHTDIRHSRARSAMLEGLREEAHARGIDDTATRSRLIDIDKLAMRWWNYEHTFDGSPAPPVAWFELPEAEKEVIRGRVRALRDGHRFDTPCPGDHVVTEGADYLPDRVLRTSRSLDEHNADHERTK